MSKLSMLDKLIELEDEYEKEHQTSVQEKVYRKMDELYGGEGVRICNIYYSKQDDETVEEECDDCEKKAQTLLESIKRSSSIIDSMNSEDVSVAISAINNRFDELVDKFVCNFNSKLKDLSIGTNVDLTRNILIRLIIDYFQTKKKENEKEQL